MTYNCICCGMSLFCFDFIVFLICIKRQCCIFNFWQRNIVRSTCVCVYVCVCVSTKNTHTRKHIYARTHTQTCSFIFSLSPSSPPSPLMHLHACARFFRHTQKHTECRSKLYFESLKMLMSFAWFFIAQAHQKVLSPTHTHTHTHTHTQTPTISLSCAHTYSHRTTQICAHVVI